MDDKKQRLCGLESTSRNKRDRRRGGANVKRGKIKHEPVLQKKHVH